MKVLVLFSIEKKEPHLQWAVAKKRFLFCQKRNRLKPAERKQLRLEFVIH